MVTAVRGAAEITLVPEETQKPIDWAQSVHNSDATLFHKAKLLATRLGAYPRGDGLTDIGFWVLELSSGEIQPKNIYLEIFTPLHPVDPRQDWQTLKFRLVCFGGDCHVLG